MLTVKVSYVDSKNVILDQIALKFTVSSLKTDPKWRKKYDCFLRRFSKVSNLRGML